MATLTELSVEPSSTMMISSAGGDCAKTEERAVEMKAPELYVVMSAATFNERTLYGRRQC